MTFWFYVVFRLPGPIVRDMNNATLGSAIGVQSLTSWLDNQMLFLNVVKLVGTSLADIDMGGITNVAMI